MSAHWHIGMEVECIDEDFGEAPCLHGQPRMSGVYTISEIYAVKEGDRTGVNRVATEDFCSVALKELGSFQAWDTDHFRPVTNRATDISIFTALLTPSEDDKAEIELLDYESMAVPFQ